MAERIVSTSSSSSSLQEEVDEKQSTGSSGGDSNGKDNGKSKDGGTAKKDKKSKSSTKKDRRDTSRLLGDGVNFKAKLIGVRDVPQARGEKMAQETLQELKTLKKSSGERKLKIIINISLEGLKIREEKTKELLYLQPVHKISFISQDASDNRAFGYIYGSPDNVHTFYAIKTEKAAQQIVMCMRDLFQIAYERKKEEIEKWRMQQANQQTVVTNHSPSTSLGSQSSDGSLNSSNASEKSADASSSSSSSCSPSSSNSNYCRETNKGTDGSSEEYFNPKNKDPSSLLLDLTVDEPKRNPFDDPPYGDPFFSDPWSYVRSICTDRDGLETHNVTVTQNDPFVVVPDIYYLSPTNNLDGNVASVGQMTTSFNDPFNTSFVSGSLTKPVGDFCSYTSTPVPNPTQLNEGGVETVAVPTIGMLEKCSSTLSEISSITTGSGKDGSCPTDGGSSIIVGGSAANSTEPSIFNEGFLVTTTEVSNPEFLVGGSSCDNPSVMVPQQTMPTFIFSDLDPLGKDRPYVDKKDFFQDVKNPPKKVLKDLMAENGFATSDFGFMPAESPVSSFRVSNFDTLSTFPPPNAPPPPLPQSLYRRSLTSPTSSLEDASMAGSASSTSSVESATSSPVYEVLLPPPPPPPPRPHVNIPSFLPPPPPLPPKHNRSPLPEYGGAGSPTMENPSPARSPVSMTGVLSSPPIPIPSRRSRGAFTSLSSTSTSFSSSMSLSSSSSNRSSQNGSISDGSMPLNSPAPLEADANNNPSVVPNGIYQQQQQRSSSNTTTQSTREIQSWNLNEANMNKSNTSNPFLGDIFISPPPQPTTGTRRHNGGGTFGSAKKTPPPVGIFQKEENPFEDDEFFAALKASNDTARLSEMATTPNGNGIGALWNDPFQDNFAQNR